MTKKKIDELLRLRMVIDGTTLEEVIQDTLRMGLSGYHIYFAQYLSDTTYKNIKFEPKTRTVSLIGVDKQIKSLSEKEIQTWQSPRKNRKSTLVV